LLDRLFQLRVALPHDLIELYRLHARVLKLGEDASRLYGLMLPGIAH
jgi:hypothetical protein